MNTSQKEKEMRETQRIYQPEKVKVIGVGYAGLRIAEKLSELPEASYIEIAGVDTDASSIQKSTLKNKYLIGAEWTEGIGCGGNVLKGESALLHKSNVAVRSFVNNASLLLITGGFGGGTATGGTPIIARFAKEKNIPVVMVVTLPFAFEGHTKYEAAENQIANMIRAKHTVITIPNDLLYSVLPETTSFDKAFSMANGEVARSVLGISELLREGGVIPVDLCDLMSVLGKGKSECGVGIGFSEEKEDKINSAIKNLMSSPLLGGKHRLKNSDALIISLTGGSDLSIGEMRFALDTIKSYTGDRTEIVVGANIDKSYEGRVQITAVPITYDRGSSLQPYDEEPKEHIKKPVTQTAIIRNVHSLLNQRNDEQPELPFVSISRGIFTPTSQTLHNGVDMDIPTFQRKEIVIDKGK